MSVRFGIAGFGEALGELVEVAAAAPRFTADPDRVRGLGYRTFHRAADDVGLVDLAVAAGRAALTDACVTAADIDLVVLAVSDIAEYLYWDPAAATQARVGASRAEALLLNQACGGGVAAFDVVAGKFAVHPEFETALLIGANRVCEPYWNRMEVSNCVFSDGAAAAVLRREHPRGRWLTSEIITDGRYADFMRMEIGGAAHPFGAGTAERVQVKAAADRLREFFEGDPRRMFEFVTVTRDRGREVVERACARAGVAVEALARVVGFHDNQVAIAELAKDLGLPFARTNAALAMAHGHLGCADQLLSLSRHLAEGELVNGDVVALTSTGAGMHWACTLLQI
ncbi:3-oxoacyl-[acyl-carrier-protein] synthase III C-terminal domain-containing protein [Amycolatopsis mediterranei]|uniref:3-oxoacyl-ACP synthase III family protein n=1 Tax=Amycolatopsis mediterranei TaxID=33910 RepID=UPI003427A14F